MCESAAAAQEEDVRCRARREEVNEENEVLGGGGGGGGELLRLSYVVRAVSTSKNRGGKTISQMPSGTAVKPDFWAKKIL